jgi:hypothetical protein
MARVKDGGITEGRFGSLTFVSVMISHGAQCPHCHRLATVPVEYLHAFARMQNPVNCSNQLISYKQMEIGVARCMAVEAILNMKVRPKYILWLSDDDLMPYDGLINLFVEMEQSWSNGKKGWDVLSSLVHLKTEPPSPVMWKVGKPPMQVGKDFQVGDVVESDVANLGFGLTRPELFEEIEGPWFKTGFCKEDLPDGTDGVVMYTEDCWFFEKLRKKGKRIGVHTGVRSAHLGKNGVIY